MSQIGSLCGETVAPRQLDGALECRHLREPFGGLNLADPQLQLAGPENSSTLLIRGRPCCQGERPLLGWVAIESLYDPREQLVQAFRPPVGFERDESPHQDEGRSRMFITEQLVDQRNDLQRCRLEQLTVVEFSSDLHRSRKADGAINGTPLGETREAHELPGAGTTIRVCSLALGDVEQVADPRSHDRIVHDPSG